jgi:hypothetical protein
MIKKVFRAQKSLRFLEPKNKFKTKIINKFRVKINIFIFLKIDYIKFYIKKD